MEPCASPPHTPFPGSHYPKAAAAAAAAHKKPPVAKKKEALDAT